MELGTRMPLEFDTRFIPRCDHPILESHIPEESKNRMTLSRVSLGMEPDQIRTSLMSNLQVRPCKKGGYKLGCYPIVLNVSSKNAAICLASRIQRIGEHVLGRSMQRELLGAEKATLEFGDLGDRTVVVYSGVAFTGLTPLDWVSKREVERVKALVQRFRESKWCIRITPTHPNEGEIISAVRSLTSIPAGRQLLFELDEKVTRVYTIYFVRGSFLVRYNAARIEMDASYSRMFSTLSRRSGYLKAIWSDLGKMIAHEFLHVLIDELVGRVHEKSGFDDTVLVDSARYDLVTRRYHSNIGPFFPAFTGLSEQEVIMGVKHRVADRDTLTFHLSENLLRFQDGGELRFGHIHYTRSDMASKSLDHLKEVPVLDKWNSIRNDLHLAVLKNDIVAIDDLVKGMSDFVYLGTLHFLVVDCARELVDLTSLKHAFNCAVAENIVTTFNIENILESLLRELIRKVHKHHILLVEYILSINPSITFEGRGARQVARDALITSIPWTDLEKMTNTLKGLAGLKLKRKANEYDDSRSKRKRNTYTRPVGIDYRWDDHLLTWVRSFS